MIDSLKVELSKNSIQLIHEVTSKNSSNTSSILPVIITVIGMLLVALITIASQQIITRNAFKADLNKIQKQIELDFNSKNRFDWILNFRNLVSELILITDPIYNKEIDKLKMLSLITQTQIMLDNTDKDENELIGLITNLGLKSDMLKKANGESEILKIHSAITDKTRTLLKKKQFN